MNNKKFNIMTTMINMKMKCYHTCHNSVLGSLYEAAICIVHLTKCTQTNIQVFQSLAQGGVILKAKCSQLSIDSLKS